MESFIKFVILTAMMFALGLLFTWSLMWCINYVFAPSLLLTLFGISHMTFWKTFVLSVVATSLTNKPATMTDSK